MKNIAYVAGKSGGHIIPCLTLAARYKHENPGARTVFFSTQHALDKQLLTNPAVDTHVILPLHSASRRTWYLYPVLLAELANAFCKSVYLLHKNKIEEVVSTGGLIAIPVIFAARLLRIPVRLWELNVEPGKAISFLSRYATTINLCFPQTQRYLPQANCVLAQYPVRYTAQDIQEPHAARQALGLDPHRFTIFILGGSQGSVSLNLLVKNTIEQYPELRTSVQYIHQSGASQAIDWQSWYEQQAIPALTFAYRDNVAPLLSAADLIITRAGAGAIFETALFGKKTIIAPLSINYTQHQCLNAAAYAKQYPDRVAVLNPEHQNNPRALFAIIEPFLKKSF